MRNRLIERASVKRERVGERKRVDKEERERESVCVWERRVDRDSIIDKEEKYKEI